MDGSVACPGCGESWSRADNFCGACGSPLPYQGEGEHNAEDCKYAVSMEGEVEAANEREAINRFLLLMEEIPVEFTVEEVGE